jgi:biotin carboxyl carrier protein
MIAEFSGQIETARPVLQGFLVDEGETVEYGQPFAELGPTEE